MSLVPHRFPSLELPGSIRAGAIVFVVFASALAAGCHEGESSSPCAFVTCSDHGDCVVSSESESATCMCDEGYEPHGFDCLPVAGDGDPGPCPANMVLNPATSTCIDRWEASTEYLFGPAKSLPGRPPDQSPTWDEARDACVASGKRLCTDLEWLTACQGDPPQAFPYGDEFDPDACHVSPPDEYLTLPVNTGTMPDCVGALEGLYDMSGNVAEWTADCDEEYCFVRGGSFTDRGSGTACNASWPYEPGAYNGTNGFRCCRDPD